ncbi:MAG: DUF86 domain-containing protein [Cyclobacteriaceae bacterium]|nr:DUF86 domain-containing protein [Cyclobacteriaceae bacterium]
MNEDILKYLQDILDAISFIQNQFQGKKVYNEFHKNELLKAAVERKISIIGEALGKALKIDPNLEITNKQKIVSMRNRIIHSYDAVDDIMLWEVVINHLPVLKNEVQQLLIKN